MMHATKKLNENVTNIWTQELSTTVNRNKESLYINKIQAPQQ